MDISSGGRGVQALNWMKRIEGLVYACMYIGDKKSVLSTDLSLISPSLSLE